MRELNARTENGDENSARYEPEDNPKQTEGQRPSRANRRLPALPALYYRRNKQQSRIQAKGRSSTRKQDQARANRIENRRQRHHRATGEISGQHQTPRILRTRFTSQHTNQCARDPANESNVKSRARQRQQASP